jgi:hypothetical protein
MDYAPNFPRVKPNWRFAFSMPVVPVIVTPPVPKDPKFITRDKSCQSCGRLFGMKPGLQMWHQCVVCEKGVCRHCATRDAETGDWACETVHASRKRMATDYIMAPSYMKEWDKQAHQRCTGIHADKHKPKSFTGQPTTGGPGGSPLKSALSRSGSANIGSRRGGGTARKQRVTMTPQMTIRQNGRQPPAPNPANPPYRVTSTNPTLAHEWPHGPQASLRKPMKTTHLPLQCQIRQDSNHSTIRSWNRWPAVSS